jgi:hypothetical protein
MNYPADYYIYLISLIVSCFISLYRFQSLDAGSRVISILICCALINEGAAFLLAKKYHNNLPLYNIYCIVEYGVLCIYFNFSIDVFVRKNIGIYLAVAGIALGTLNLIFIQSLNTMNSYFLFFEGLMVIGMALFAFFRLLLIQQPLQLYRSPHFWFLCILVFFWSITFLNWGLYDYLYIKFRNVAGSIDLAMMIIGIMTYGALSCVFLLYPKMKAAHE